MSSKIVYIAGMKTSVNSVEVSSPPIKTSAAAFNLGETDVGENPDAHAEIGGEPENDHRARQRGNNQRIP